MIPFIPALLAKLTLIFATGLIVAGAMRGSAPSLRHLVLLATLTCGLTLPVIMLLSPRWNVALLPQSSPVLSSAALAPVAPSASRRSVRIDDGQSSETNNIAAASPAKKPIPAGGGSNVEERAALIIPLIWVLGCLGILSWLAIGRLRLRRIGRTSWPLNGNDWKRMLDEVRAEAGVTRTVKLSASPVVSTPLTWGWLSPVVLLPDDALDWGDEHRRIVLRHELAHIARKDSVTQLMAGFVCAIYWFHPLVWMLERRMRAECERVCDDRVVSLGTPPTEYASHLLEVARSARAFGAPGFLSVAMARPSQLEGRLLAVLNGPRRAAAVSRAARFGAVGMSAFVLLPLAAFTPVTRPAPAPGISTAAAGQSNPSPDRSEPFARALESVAAPQLSAGQPGSKGVEKPVNTNGEKAVNTYQDADSTFQLSAPVRSGGTLELDLKTGGAVTISSWDRAEVQVRAALRGRSWRETRVSLRPYDGGATLESNFAKWSNNQSSSHQFIIQVPRSFNVRIKSAGGSVSISNVAGNFRGNTGGGEITVKNANGDIDLRTGGGEVNVSDSNLNGTVATGGGLIKIVRVNGSLNGYSGSGPVIYTDSRDPRRGTGMGIGEGKGTSIGVSDDGTGVSATTVTSATGKKTTTTYTSDDGGKDYGYGPGAVRWSAAGGPLSLESAPHGARVTTGGGRIRIGPSGGEVYALTGGGPIDIGPATGSVAAHTGAGDVTIQLTGSDSHDVDVTSGRGDVVLVVPSDLNATLELETAYTENHGRKTRIVSDWPLSITETNEWDDSYGTPRKYVRVRQNIGRGGGVIRVRTVNGNVELKRGR
ncbi:MAG TPA: M56 family metallopeptidase [Gemmatimonadaceae bacterium]|nr:M56 family metallopeptidase [Gemmatimonadaceae bacterium]